MSNPGVGTRIALGRRDMTLIAIVAALLVTSLGAINIAWGVSHLLDDSRPLRLTSPRASQSAGSSKGR